MNLLEIWKNRKQILEGILNKFRRKPNVERVYEDRLKICVDCPDIDIIGNKCLLPGTEPCCSLCGCSLEIKLRSLSTECPAKEPKWKAILTEEEENQLNPK